MSRAPAVSRGANQSDRSSNWSAGGERLEDARGQHAHAHEEARRPFPSEVEATADASHAALGVDPDAAEALLSGIPQQHQRASVAALAMAGREPRQVGIQEHVAREHQAGIALSQEVRRRFDAASRSQKLRFG
jgi:hypothetical protein